MSQITSTLKEIYTSNGVPIGNTSEFVDTCDNHFQYSIVVPSSGEVNLFTSNKTVTQFTGVKDDEVKYIRIANKGNETLTMSIADGTNEAVFKIPPSGFFVIYSSKWVLNNVLQDITEIIGVADATTTRVEVLIGVE